MKTENVQYSGAYTALGVDNSLGLHEFRNNFRVEVIRLSEDDIEFDLIGIDASIANAFRRILISEVSSLASTTPSEKALRLCFLLSFIFLLFFISFCQEILKIVNYFYGYLCSFICVKEQNCASSSVIMFPFLFEFVRKGVHLIQGKTPSCYFNHIGIIISMCILEQLGTSFVGGLSL